MQIYLCNGIFSENKARDILSVIEEAISQNHSVIFEDTNSPEFLVWLNECSTTLNEPDLLSLLELQLTSSLLVISKRSIRAISNNEISCRKSKDVTFNELKNSLLRSFYFYVENARADKRFLFCMLGGEIQKDLQKLISKGALIFENGGGITELHKKIDDDFIERELLQLRSFACFDSDALEPGKPSEQAQNVIKLCNILDIPHYCLKRRAIENYIPYESLMDFSNAGTPKTKRDHLKKLTRAFSRLSDQ